MVCSRQQRAELECVSEFDPSGPHSSISADETPIQHATVLLPITALLPYSNALLLTWKADGWADATNSQRCISCGTPRSRFEGIQHFAEMPKLERFAEAGYPFTRYADLSKTAVVMGNNDVRRNSWRVSRSGGIFRRADGVPRAAHLCLYRHRRWDHWRIKI